MELQPITNPFVGLRPFEEDESLLFFGRHEQSLELLERLHEHHFVAVIGSSGSGKSSLIRAGLIPRLKAGYLVEDRDRWMISIAKPGQQPLFNLLYSVLSEINTGNIDTAVSSLLKNTREDGADALLSILKPVCQDQHTNVLLLIDQFEELFRFSMEQNDVEKKNDAIDFVNILLELTRQIHLPIYVVITMRSDFIGDCAQFFGLPEAMNRSQYLVPRLSRTQLKSTIEGPIRLYGEKINPSLTSRLLNDLGTITDELPILQHALMRIWDHEMTVHRSGELDLPDYNFIGGLEKALSNHADEALQGMNGDDLHLAKRIFQALTTIDENGRKIRKPATLEELRLLTGAGKKELLNIINRFIEDKRSFLVVSKTGNGDDLLIDISHESLIRQWNTLGEWVDEEAGAAKNYLRLAEQADLYAQQKKDLLAGSELQIASVWYKTFAPSATWAKRYDDGFEKNVEYLRNSEMFQDRLKKRKIARRRNQFIIISLLVAGIITLLIFINLNQTKLKNEALAQKEKADLLYESFRLNALANELTHEDLSTALRLEEAALKINYDSIILKAAHNIYFQHAFYKTIISDSFSISYCAISPDGREIVTGFKNGRLKLWDSTGRFIKEFVKEDGEIGFISFSPDATQIIILVNGGRRAVKCLDRGGKVIRTFMNATSGFASHDGSKMLVNYGENKVQLVDGQDRVIGELKGEFGFFSPDGKNILTGSAEDKLVRLYSMKGGLVKTFKGVWPTFSPDGTRFLTSGLENNTIRLWKINGELIREFTMDLPGFYIGLFTPDGSKFIAWDMLAGVFNSSEDESGMMKCWDIDGKLVREFKQKGVVNSLSFFPDGSKMITASGNGSVKLWDLGDLNSITFKGHTSTLNAIAFSPDGTKILTGSADSTIRLWKVNGTLIKKFQSENAVYSLAFSPDGRQFVAGSYLPFVELWNLDSSAGVVMCRQKAAVGVAEFSPDGSKLLTVANDSTVQVWTVAGSNLFTLGGNNGKFSPDGKMILVSDTDSLAKLYNDEGKWQKTFKGGNFIAFSSNGTRILTGPKDSAFKNLLDLNGKLISRVSKRGIVAISPDSKKILAESGPTGVLELWDLDGHLLYRFEELRYSSIGNVAFSPDGANILAASASNAAILWKSVPTLEQFLQSKQIDTLTSKQKDKYRIQ